MQTYDPHSERLMPGESRYAIIEVRIDQAKLDAWTSEVARIPNGLRRVLPPALNQAAKELRTRLYEEFKSRMNVARKSSIRKRLEHTPKATPWTWQTRIRVSLERFTIASFRGVRQTAEGVTWSPTSGTRKLIPHAFVQTSYVHHQTGERMDVRQVYRRAFKGGRIVGRYPIQVLRGPSLGRVFSDDPGFQSGMERQGERILEKKVRSQVQRLLARVHG